MYAPVLQSARTKKQYRIGPYEAAFLDQVVAEGPIQYEYIIAVFMQDAPDPFLLVTSEKDEPGAADEFLEEVGLDEDLFPKSESTKYFLCLFDEDGHQNFGASNDWADAEKFERAALQIVSRRLGQPAVAV